MSYELDKSYRIMRSRNLNRKYSKSKPLNLNCGANDIFNGQVSLDGTSVGFELALISLRV